MSSKISILMAVYNAAPYLRESIESIRRQTFKEWELIAIDDASTDDSRAILSNYAEADPRIRLISLPHNGGQGKARNEGLRQAQGDYICFVDSDDCLAPGAQCAQQDRFPGIAKVGVTGISRAIDKVLVLIVELGELR